MTRLCMVIYFFKEIDSIYSVFRDKLQICLVLTVWIIIYSTVQVELNNMYTDICANNSSEELWTGKHCNFR